MKNYVNETLKDLMKLLAFFGVPIALAVGLCFYECKVDETVWNNGICHCGGEYEFSNASKRKSQTYYYYYCDDCGNVIETISPQKNKKVAKKELTTFTPCAIM